MQRWGNWRHHSPQTKVRPSHLINSVVAAHAYRLIIDLLSGLNAVAGMEATWENLKGASTDRRWQGVVRDFVLYESEGPAGGVSKILREMHPNAYMPPHF